MLLTTFKYSRHIVLPQGKAIHILLHQDATSRDIVQARPRPPVR